MAYRTLHYVLVRLSMILAPFTPFLAEELYQKLTGGESVHLLDWPETGIVNEIVLQEMTTVRELITKGLAQRAEAGVKVRQPLSMAAVTLPFNVTDPDQTELRTIMAEELNVHTVAGSVGEQPDIKLDTNLTEELRVEGAMRELVRHIQNLRKNAKLQVDDRIILSVDGEGPLTTKALHKFKEVIMQETLAIEWHEGALEHTQTVKVEGETAVVNLQKA
jgi:isoleucyl-tRNA synthetase